MSNKAPNMSILLKNKLPSIQQKIAEKANDFQVNQQLYGHYIGVQMSINIVDEYVKKEKLTRRDKRKLDRQLTDYITNAEKYARKLDVSEFVFEFALGTITKTIETLTEAIDFDSFENYVS